MKQFFLETWQLYKSRHFYDETSKYIYLIFLFACAALGFILALKGIYSDSWAYWLISTPIMIVFSYLETYYQKKYKDEK